MNYSIEEKENIMLVRLEGNLMGDTSANQLLDDVAARVEDDRHLCAVDLSNVSYMNSNGIGVLINLLTKMRNRGGEVVLINPSQQIQKLLVITKLNSIFDIVDSEEDAMAQLNKK
ncbi:anti-sigma B factor antagonist [Catalinimonas alkaloidigena]|uniref:Anti-sigma factor antagonist n=1 Tax=Catalinimonas alkaloidigena TaxID=1075417 RepID=A0A1G9IYG2_9BACT|nr:STAS domain-containing protein [Catalinimonas alkaloidigena]SDL30125.1 anti-sigma B factor antagonist [Catalinimonas alkaloidigena]